MCAQERVRRSIQEFAATWEMRPDRSIKFIFVHTSHSMCCIFFGHQPTRAFKVQFLSRADHPYLACILHEGRKATAGLAPWQFATLKHIMYSTRQSGPAIYLLHVGPYQEGKCRFLFLRLYG